MTHASQKMMKRLSMNDGSMLFHMMDVASFDEKSRFLAAFLLEKAYAVNDCKNCFTSSGVFALAL